MCKSNVKIKLIQNDEQSKMCADSLIICCKPICKVSASIFAENLLLLLDNQVRKFALKLSYTAFKNGLKLKLILVRLLIRNKF